MIFTAEADPSINFFFNIMVQVRFERPAIPRNRSTIIKGKNFDQ